MVYGAPERVCARIYMYILVLHNMYLVILCNCVSSTTSIKYFTILYTYTYVITYSSILVYVYTYVYT